MENRNVIVLMVGWMNWGELTGQVEWVDSNFLCSEYDGGDDRAAYDTDWWLRRSSLYWIWEGDWAEGVSSCGKMEGDCRIL